MKILSWDIYGLKSPRKVRRLQHSLKTYPHIVFKLFKIQMERVQQRCGFVSGIKVNSEGTKGGLCLAWQNAIHISLQMFSKRHIDVVVKDNERR